MNGPVRSEMTVALPPHLSIGPTEPSEWPWRESNEKATETRD